MISIRWASSAVKGFVMLMMLIVMQQFAPVEMQMKGIAYAFLALSSLFVGLFNLPNLFRLFRHQARLGFFALSMLGVYIASGTVGFWWLQTIIETGQESFSNGATALVMMCVAVISGMVFDYLAYDKPTFEPFKKE